MDAEVLREGLERGGRGLFADGVGVAFERGVELVRQVVEV